jgi:hypothetical protein
MTIVDLARRCSRVAHRSGRPLIAGLHTAGAADAQSARVLSASTTRHFPPAPQVRSEFHFVFVASVLAAATLSACSSTSTKTSPGPASKTSSAAASTSPKVQAPPAAASSTTVYLPKASPLAGAESTLIIVPCRPTQESIHRGHAFATFGFRRVVAPLYCLLPADPIDPVTVSPDTRRALSWLGPAFTNRWALRTAADAADLPVSSGALWFAALTPPIDDFPDTFMLDKLEVHVERAPMQSAAADTELRGPSSNLLVASAALLDVSPLERWRARLIRQQPLASLVPNASGAGNPLDPISDAVAFERECRWAFAIARLREANRSLADQLLNQLAAVTTFPADLGAHAPLIAAPLLWHDPRTEDDLLTRLLDPKSTPDDRTRATRSFLARRAPAAALVVDDAGAPGAPQLLLINASESPAASWVRAALDTTDTSEPVLLAPRESRLLAPPNTAAATDQLKPIDRLIADRRAAGGRPSEVIATIGDTSLQRMLLHPPLPARPPGVTIGPFFAEWSLASLNPQFAESRSSSSSTTADPGGPGSTLPRIDPRFETLGRLYREPVAAGADPSNAPWTLYLECRHPSESGASLTPYALDLDLVTLSLGPTDAPTRSLLIRPSGEMIELDSGVNALAGTRPAGTCRVSKLADRWIAWIPIPAPPRIATNTPLLLGITRATSEPARSLQPRASWPRPMFPWQTTPGRVAIDLTAWSPDR